MNVKSFRPKVNVKINQQYAFKVNNSFLQCTVSSTMLRVNKLKQTYSSNLFKFETFNKIKTNKER